MVIERRGLGGLETSPPMEIEREVDGNFTHGKKGKNVNLVHSIGEEGDLANPSQEREGRQSIQYKERMNDELYRQRGQTEKGEGGGSIIDQQASSAAFKNRLSIIQSSADGIDLWLR